MYTLIILMLLGAPVAQGQIVVQTDADTAIVRIMGVESLSAFEFRVEFDETVLEATQILQGSGWVDYLWVAGAIQPGSIDYTVGAVEDGTPAVIDESIVVARIKFKVKGAGDKLIRIMDVLAVSIDGTEILPEVINATLRLDGAYPKPIPK